MSGNGRLPLDTGMLSEEEQRMRTEMPGVPLVHVVKTEENKENDTDTCSDDATTGNDEDATTGD